MEDRKRLIEKPRRIIVACDVETLNEYEEIIKKTHDHSAIGGYKIGSLLAITYSLPRLVEITRKYTQKPIIYDHQKAGTDIPDLGKKFMKTVKYAGTDAIIVFPLSGSLVLEKWVKAAYDEGLYVLVGGLMTHKQFLISEGGYIGDKEVYDIYKRAAQLGVRDFVVPGTKPEEIRKIKDILIESNIEPIFYSPGLITQGGEITEAGKAAGKEWHAIIGRAIYASKDVRKTLDELYKAIKESEN